MEKLIVAMLAVLVVVGCGEEKPKLTISRETVIRDLTGTMFVTAEAPNADMRKHHEANLAREIAANKVSESERAKSSVAAWSMAIDKKNVLAALYLVFICAETNLCMSTSLMVSETFDLAHATNETGVMGALVKNQKFSKTLSVERRKFYADLRCAEIVKYFQGNDKKREQLINEFFGLLKDYGSCASDARAMAIQSAKDSLRYGHTDWACTILRDNGSADEKATAEVLDGINIPPTLVKQFTDCVETKKLANRTETEIARDCAILYNTGSEHERLFRESNSRKNGELAMIIYGKMFVECPDYSHTAEAKTAVAQIETNLK